MSSRRAPWWMYIIAASLLGNLGLNIYLYFGGPEPPFGQFNFKREALVVEEVLPNSAGARAGAQVGDRVVSIDGRRVLGLGQWDEIRINFEVGKPYRLQVERDGKQFERVMTLQRRSWSQQVQYDRISFVLRTLSALLALFVAFLIAFTRPYDWTARLGALSIALLGSYTYPYGVSAACRRLPIFVGALIWWPTVGFFILPALFFVFLLNFPAQTVSFPMGLGSGADASFCFVTVWYYCVDFRHICESSGRNTHAGLASTARGQPPLCVPGRWFGCADPELPPVG